MKALLLCVVFVGLMSCSIPKNVIYDVSAITNGSGATVDIYYVDSNDKNVTLTAVQPPWQKSFTYTSSGNYSTIGVSAKYDSVSNPSVDPGNITVTVYVDGSQVATDTESGFDGHYASTHYQISN